MNRNHWISITACSFVSACMYVNRTTSSGCLYRDVSASDILYVCVVVRINSAFNRKFFVPIWSASAAHCPEQPGQIIDWKSSRKVCSSHFLFTFLKLVLHHLLWLSFCKKNKLRFLLLLWLIMPPPCARYGSLVSFPWLTGPSEEKKKERREEESEGAVGAHFHFKRGSGEVLQVCRAERSRLAKHHVQHARLTFHQNVEIHGLRQAWNNEPTFSTTLSVSSSTRRRSTVECQRHL